MVIPDLIRPIKDRYSRWFTGRSGYPCLHYIHMYNFLWCLYMLPYRDIHVPNHHIHSYQYTRLLLQYIFSQGLSDTYLVLSPLPFRESLPEASRTNGCAKIIAITNKTFFTSTNGESLKMVFQTVRRSVRCLANLAFK